MPAPPAPRFIYLASQSPRRRQLLAQIGVAHELLLPGAEEDAEGLEAERPGEAPAAYCARVTAAKLEAAVQRLATRGLPPAPILCADTTVALGAQILGKPQDAADAARILGLLSGGQHEVITSVAVAPMVVLGATTYTPTAASAARANLSPPFNSRR